MKLSSLLVNALLDIDVLEEYFSEQYDSTLKHIKKEHEKYKYGFAIYKYLCGRLHNEQEPHCMNKAEKKFIAEEVIIIEDEENKKNVQYKVKNLEKYDKYELDPIYAEKKIRSLFEQPFILNDSIIIMLLIRYENIISELYKQLLVTFPEAYLKEKSITYSDLISMNSNIDEIKRVFIDAEIDEFMRRPLKEWYGTFSQKHKLQFNLGKEFEQFKEIYYRRNIVVHNQGKANNSYIEGVSDKYKCNLGTKLSPTKEYIQESLDCTRIIIVETFLGMTKLADDKEDIINHLFDIAFEYMQKNKWQVSKYIFNALNNAKGQSDAQIWCNTVNYFVSCKNLDGLESIRKDVENMDISLMKPRLAIAKPALLDNFDDVSSYLESMIENDFSINEIKTWPLLIQYRESNEYMNFIANHRELFEVESCSTEEISCLSEHHDDRNA